MKSLFGNILLLIFLIILISCREDNNAIYKQQILGKWERPVNVEIEAPPPGFDKISYMFLHDSAIYFPGIYLTTSKTSEFINRKYIGNKIKYEIMEDTLILFFPNSNIGSSNYLLKKYKILFINRDSLLLKSDDNNIFKYKRVENN